MRGGCSPHQGIQGTCILFLSGLHGTLFMFHEAGGFLKQNRKFKRKKLEVHCSMVRTIGLGLASSSGSGIYSCDFNLWTPIYTVHSVCIANGHLWYLNCFHSWIHSSTHFLYIWFINMISFYSLLEKWQSSTIHALKSILLCTSI